ncbi:hypothetical protein PQ465_13785 [Sphingobacterium oryzagri]|uniref:Uncharacterized protein n=1 Tax=Sphingobacterium oryzagri TaxID=3025669 RepID=A0ABY7WFR9_9SPHI|nr:hypothetical protein [Sphingobacterium sp. KACC 22765]WDF67376.1 hypothetical protein PQ465_13785 [Sphingobacterium sp. KACC 22765]
MFTKLIAIDNQLIGTVHFHAFVVNLGGDDVGFALFMNDLPDPLLYFSKEGTDQVNFTIDNQQFLWIVKNSKFTREDRKRFYDQFEFFLRAMEQRAKAYLFKNSTVQYISNSRDIIRYKNYYITASVDMMQNA